ncbi:carboxypeptidase-like regulatory domain-containing protein [uncultured Draconibacterium sp.]|uniref:TonB-dependent receptor n=1 Tax=uncultured Draconibacterium sp. TaxID=1573823 RepID=UPI0025F34B95|nr:carboxypeptidase-like regulatory domain-containing protein [uncultured Draconibacterium sp.]
MAKIVLVFFVFLASINVAYSQYSLSGKVLNADKKTPIEFATIVTSDNNFWAITDYNGDFTIKLPKGEFSLIISCLGYEKTSSSVSIKNQSVSNQVFYIKENNLSLDEVVVTAQKKDELATSYSIDRNALTHAQTKDISDLMSQLPGGQTSYETDATSERYVVLRSDSRSEIDNPSFGTAIEVDGVRLTSNSNFSSFATDGIDGIDIRNIAVNNIESVEIVTGLPSVENGDLSAGLMKIHTRKGKSPLEVEVITKPNTKSYSATKGFDLGRRRGLINTSLEHTKSIKDRVSPYTTYTRNNMSLTYRNTIGPKSKPIDLTYGITGNLGGYNSENDPDRFVGTYEKQKDYALRSNLNVKWLLNLPYLTGLDFSASVNYADKKREEKENEDSSASTVANHSTEEGYFIATDYDENPNAETILIPAGSWYEIMYNDDKPVTYSAKLKANWVQKKGEFINRIKVGGEVSFSGNYGKGEFYDDLRYAPTWREYRYDEQPFVNNYSFYAEDKVIFPVFGNQMDIQAGIRSDITSIKGTEYGTVQGWSPRINAQYVLYENKNSLLKYAKIHAGWGDAVKLPSANVLYPRPAYSDRLAFASTSDAVGTAFYAYYSMPISTIYNTSLNWQRRRKLEVGTDFRIGNTRISLTAYRDKTFDPYRQADHYIPVAHKLTDQSDLEESQIPREDQVYDIDQSTGIVTVSDATGTLESEELNYTVKNRFKKDYYYANGSSVIRKGLEWIIDFGKIEALKTSVRLDGSYYSYKGVNETIQEGMSTSALSIDGSPYKYVGFYVGNDGVNNGSETKKLRTNVTVTTHIPAIRMIVSCRLEGCLYDYSRKLSEYSDGTRSYVLDDPDAYLPSSSGENIYDGNNYVATYPLYYKSINDMETEVLFLEKFLWAKENDPDLYNDLSRLVKKSSKDYYFQPEKYSPYFSANLNVTKEIGDRISLTFKATNFFNNTGKITNSQTGNEESLYYNSSGKIAKFYYGLSMRIKL